VSPSSRARRAGHDQGAPVGGQGLGQLAARGQVQVVGRLVQQQHVGAAQELGGQAEQDRLAARHLTDAPVQLQVAQPEPVEGGPGALLDVPVVPDGGEAVLGRLAPLDGRQRPADPGDTEHLVDRPGGVQVRSWRR
jgi:hypothetical protein